MGQWTDVEFSGEKRLVENEFTDLLLLLEPLCARK